VATRSDLAEIICRLLNQATASWTTTFRLALLLAALAAGPAAVIALIVVIR
jgi:hypothetical protein